MNVVDSSGWIEFFTGSPNAAWFEAPIRDLAHLIVPSITVYEVYRHAMRTLGEIPAETMVGAMSQGAIVELGIDLAMSAAELGLQHKLAMADSIVLATARAWGATIWTQDADFESIEGVKYRPRRS